MKFDFTKLAAPIEEKILKTESPRQKAILENFRMHLMLEVAGRYEEIFSPELTVDHPIYNWHRADGEQTLEGRDALLDFYRKMVESENAVLYISNAVIAVEDWGFMMEAVFNKYMPGHLAASLGHKVPDQAGTYIQREWICVRFPHDVNGLLIGENVYKTIPFSITRCADDEIVTMSDARKVLAPIIAEGPFESGGRYAVPLSEA